MIKNNNKIDNDTREKEEIISSFLLTRRTSTKYFMFGIHDNHLIYHILRKKMREFFVKEEIDAIM